MLLRGNSKCEAIGPVLKIRAGGWLGKRHWAFLGDNQNERRHTSPETKRLRPARQKDQHNSRSVQSFLFSMMRLHDMVRGGFHPWPVDKSNPTIESQGFVSKVHRDNGLSKQPDDESFLPQAPKGSESPDIDGGNKGCCSLCNHRPRFFQTVHSRDPASSKPCIPVWGNLPNPEHRVLKSELRLAPCKLPPPRVNRP